MNSGTLPNAAEQSHPTWQAHHFDTPTQQFEAAKLGMWVFLVTETLMFGGLFVAYSLYRIQAPEVFVAAHHHLNKTLGALNTVVLLFSSLTAALAVRSSQLGERTKTSVLLVVTLVCACLFLGIKYTEYAHKIHDGLLPGRYFGHPGFDLSRNATWDTPLHSRANMFFALYFMMTGLHGVHVLIGMGLLTWVLIRNLRGEFSREYFTPVEITGLYWHLVDLVWIYVFPMLYLIG